MEVIGTSDEEQLSLAIRSCFVSTCDEALTRLRPAMHPLLLPYGLVVPQYPQDTT